MLPTLLILFEHTLVGEGSHTIEPCVSKKVMCYMWLTVVSDGISEVKTRVHRRSDSIPSQHCSENVHLLYAGVFHYEHELDVTRPF